MHLERGRLTRRASLAWEEEGFMDIARGVEGMGDGQWDAQGSGYKVPWLGNRKENRQGESVTLSHSDRYSDVTGHTDLEYILHHPSGHNFENRRG